jgi:carbamoyl-phosphate synthase large subunit
MLDMNLQPDSALNVVTFAPRRRNYFLSALRRSARTREIPLTIHGLDQDSLDPFVSACDLFTAVPPLGSDLGRIEAAKLLATPNALFFGWNDQDIHVLSQLRDCVAVDSALALPGPDVVQLMHDKLATKQWARKHAFDTAVEVSSFEDISPENRVVVKPRCGQGSVNVYLCKSIKAVEVAIEEQTTEFLVEEFVSGSEFTVDVVCYEGELVAAVPRKRVKVRGGEVLVAQVDMRADLIELAKRICFLLGDSMIFNFQVIGGPSNYKLIEMNPRFGGGSDLTIAAGLDLPGAYLDIFVRKVRPELPRELKDGLVMSRRFESSFFMSGD